VKQQLGLLCVAVETFVAEDTFTRYLGRTHLAGLLAGVVVATLFSGSKSLLLQSEAAVTAKACGAAWPRSAACTRSATQRQRGWLGSGRFSGAIGGRRA
jgi:hypothetical protein